MEFILRTPKSHPFRFVLKTNLKYFGVFDWSVFETTAHVKICKFTAFSSGSFCQIYRVTDEALIAETVEWPNFFLMNMFFALKDLNYLLLHILMG